MSGILDEDSVELVERLHQCFQEARSDSALQGDGQAGRVPQPVDGVVSKEVLFKHFVMRERNLPRAELHLRVSGGHWGLLAHLATSNKRDGRGGVDHPGAVNVVHNLLDFFADHLHTND
jgi:hypothetical protein